MTEKSIERMEGAGEALANLRKGLDGARRLIEQTRFLLVGGERGDSDALVAGQARAAQETVEPTDHE